MYETNHKMIRMTSILIAAVTLGAMVVASVTLADEQTKPATPSPAAVPAFPGAEGYGAKTSGGRGGKVLAVTNLNASGPGSLQAACDADGPRIVVFKVAGTIDGDIRIRGTDPTEFVDYTKPDNNINTLEKSHEK